MERIQCLIKEHNTQRENLYINQKQAKISKRQKQRDASPYDLYRKICQLTYLTMKINLHYKKKNELSGSSLEPEIFLTPNSLLPVEINRNRKKETKMQTRTKRAVHKICP